MPTTKWLETCSSNFPMYRMVVRGLFHTQCLRGFFGRAIVGRKNRGILGEWEGALGGKFVPCSFVRYLCGWLCIIKLWVVVCVVMWGCSLWKEAPHHLQQWIFKKKKLKMLLHELLMCLCCVCVAKSTVWVHWAEFARLIEFKNVFLQVPEGQCVCVGTAEETEHYEVCRTCVEELALYLKPISGGKGMFVCVCGDWWGISMRFSLLVRRCHFKRPFVVEVQWPYAEHSISCFPLCVVGACASEMVTGEDTSLLQPATKRPEFPKMY